MDTRRNSCLARALELALLTVTNGTQRGSDASSKRAGKKDSSVMLFSGRDSVGLFFGLSFVIRCPLNSRMPYEHVLGLLMCMFAALGSSDLVWIGFQ